jgi:SAM-dependent methyltransferase
VHGTETSKEVSLWQLRIPHPHAKLGGHYQATSPQSFLEACRCLPAEAKSFSFVDIGCGKGRILILAKECGFQKVTGVDLSAELLETARANLDKLGMRDVELENCSATDYAFGDSPLVVFMFNPFGPPLLAELLDKVAEHPHKDLVPQQFSVSPRRRLRGLCITATVCSVRVTLSPLLETGNLFLSCAWSGIRQHCERTSAVCVCGALRSSEGRNLTRYLPGGALDFRRCARASRKLLPFDSVNLENPRQSPKRTA